MKIESGKCQSEGFFRDPVDCVQFYRCTKDPGAENFRLYKFACGPGTVFDPTISTCNHPHAAPPCDQPPPQTPPQTPPEPQPQPPPPEETIEPQEQPQPPEEPPAEQPLPQSQPEENLEPRSEAMPPAPSSRRQRPQMEQPSADSAESQPPAPSSSSDDEWPESETPTDNVERLGSAADPKPDEPAAEEAKPETEEKPKESETEQIGEQELTSLDTEEITPEDESCNCKPLARIFQCKKDGRFSDKQNCRNYYRCSKSEDGEGFNADMFECDMGYAFEEETASCVPESESKCIKEKATRSKSGSKSKASPKDKLKAEEEVGKFLKFFKNFM